MEKNGVQKETLRNLQLFHLPVILAPASLESHLNDPNG